MIFYDVKKKLLFSFFCVIMLTELEMNYSAFVVKYKDLPKKLAGCRADYFAPTQEHAFYNKGTMAQPSSENIAIVNAQSFNVAFHEYRILHPEMAEDEAKARVVFDFLQKNGSKLSYEKNEQDVLFESGSYKVTRKDFYANVIYADSQQNTNYFSRHIGDMQIITLPEMPIGKMPRNIEGLSPAVCDKIKQIAPETLQEIFLKRGLYHETVHAAMGTSDERKCDAFALLKVMKEHPFEAQEIFAIYNQARSKIGYVVDAIHQRRGNNQELKNQVRIGTMTYLMPQTYGYLKEFALHPEKIPNRDEDMLKLTYDLTSRPDFAAEDLTSFMKLMQKDSISTEELSKSKVVQACMKQGGFKDIGSYIACDKKLSQFMAKYGIQSPNLTSESQVSSVVNNSSFERE